MIEGTADQPSASGQLEREAARWCSLLHGSDADTHRPKFEAWLKRGALHREAYNKVEEVYLLGAKLPRRMLADATPASSRQSIRDKLLVIGVPLALVGVIAIPFARRALESRAANELTFSGATVHMRLSTLRTVGQSFRLSDGSVVALGPDSELAVDYGSGKRGLRLARGHGSFDVAHQDRPFVVHAGAGTVTALGTSFDVAIVPPESFRVHVSRGTVEVRVPSRSIAMAKPSVRLVPADQAQSFPLHDDQPPALPPTVPDAQPLTVGELIAGANERAGGGPILRVADPRLLDLRLGGTFRVHEPGVVAERLALMLDLITIRTPGQITLQSRQRRP